MSQTKRNILITGGAGFIGSNLANRLLTDPTTHICIFDNLSRHGVEQNLAWLKTQPGAERLDFIKGDVRNSTQVEEVARDATEIYHLAAQVAVTKSIDAPRNDFDVNVLGTFNVLEAARQFGRRPFLLFTSTNKVYGGLHGVPVTVHGTHYCAQDEAFAGVAESEPLDFHSPYGCSKGAADQYVHDYARIYGLPTVVFRMSCIAGPRQFGTEDQGWVAHFLYSVLEGKPITVFGDGYQVRDILHVHDLVDAIQATQTAWRVTAGHVYNVGGGLERAVSVVEVLELIAKVTGIAPVLNFSEVRPGDQPLYISNTSHLSTHTGWSARRSFEETLDSIHHFWRSQGVLFKSRRRVADQELRSEVLA